MLGWITTHLDPDMVRPILDGITLGAAHWVEVHDPAIAKGDHDLEQEVLLLQGAYQSKCMLMIGQEPREKIQCWVQS